MNKAINFFSSACVFVLSGGIKLYKLCLSPFLPCSCRYYPSCSSYAEEALHRHGALRGLWLAGKRVLRCNPYFAGGYDPVPESFHLFKNKHK